MNEGIILKESIEDYKKNEIKLKDYFKSFLQTSIFITMVMFGLVTIKEMLRLIIDFSIFIKELIDPPGFIKPYWGVYEYMKFYNLIPFLGFILIFFSIINTIPSVKDMSKNKWLLVGRLFLISGLIFFILTIFQTIYDFYPIDIGFKIFEAGLFDHKTYGVYDTMLITYIIGFVIIFSNLLIIRKNMLLTIKRVGNKKKTYNVIISVIVIVEIFHLLGIVI
ncbi:MAG: hypothetical protein FK731_12475, partial [Asgard group archaeon]|nr:hypothetical protein [Asgard group archaeon]